MPRSTVAFHGNFVDSRLRQERLAHDSRRSQASNPAGSSRQSQACNALGVALRDTGEQQEGLEKLKRALVLRRSALGKEHVAVGETLNNLAVCYFMRGSFNKVAAMDQQTFSFPTT